MARAVACLTAACLLASCTGGAHHGAQRPLTPAQRQAQRLAQIRKRFAHGPVIFAVPGGVGGVVTIIGGEGGGGSRPKITVPPIPPAGSSLTVSMPLEAYEAISTQQQEVLAQASNLITQHCMAAKGFSDTSPASEPFSSVASLEAIEVGGAGLTSASQAKTFGFARPKGPGLGTAGGPAIIGFVGVSVFGDALKVGRAYTQALLGFTPGVGGAPGSHESCLQQGSQAVYGPANGTPASDPVPQIAQQSVGFTTSDPRIHAVERAWSACMAHRYYHYSSPSQVEDRHWPTPPHKAEIRTAVADVQCKARTNFLNTWLAVEAGYQAALIGRNLTALSQLQANFTPLLRRAETALAEANGLGASG
jgi:hypothetical protein